MSAAPTTNYVAEEGVANAKVEGPKHSLLQEAELDILFFKDHFVGQPHLNFVASKSPIGAVSVSLVKTEDEYKAIFRTESETRRLSCPIAEVPVSGWRRVLGLGPALSSVLQRLSPDIPISSLVLVNDGALPMDILAMEERQVIRNYKFGILYARPGQTTEAEMLSNLDSDVSEQYRQFLSFLGDTVRLKDWKGYRGGLDVASGLTGETSVYTRWQGYEIMMHVSTMLPFNENERIQLERKRHIGNDILVLIFQDSDAPVQLDSIESKHNHVFILVTPEGSGYRLRALRKNGVPHFAPELPEPSLISRDSAGRDFLLYKLINGERAAYLSPSFAPKLARTRSAMLQDVTSRYSDRGYSSFTRKLYLYVY